MLLAARLMSQPQPDARHLLLDGSLTDAEVAGRDYVYNTLKEAVRHLSDTTVLYVKPWVYWVDNPDVPEVVVGVNGREPFGMIIRTKKLSMIGLCDDARDVVFASMRGQTQGAVGNFTMFDFHVDELEVENMTMGNYCNVDLDYPRKPELGRKKRSSAITQAHVGYVHGRRLTARNVRFISRLNLNPLNGARESYYENCHFECTDDALNGSAVYRHCDFDLYGQKPFWSTLGAGPLFVDCDFHVKGENREMYFCKQGGPLTLIDCRYHAPSDSIYVGWTAYPQPWLRCYQKNFTLNGKPYRIGGRQPENAIVMDSVAMSTDRPPYLRISRHEAEMQVGGEPLALHVDGNGRKVVWRTGSLLYPDKITGDSVTLRLACDDIDGPVSIPVTACTVGNDPAVAVCMVTIKPPLLPAPTFLKKPKIKIKNGVARLDYLLDLQGRRDVTRIVWGRLDSDDCQQETILADSNEEPLLQYRLRRADIGRRLIVTMRPMHSWSEKGAMTQVVSRQITAKDVKSVNTLETDFSDIHCGTSSGLVADSWQADGYKPSDTAEYQWSFDPKRPMWEYGEGFNGAVGRGLLQAQRGARLMYTPYEQPYGDMSLTLEVDPTKTAGQGFGSATGQYMDICLKFDTKTLTGYGLRIIRTTKYAKAVDFYLVEYRQGEIRPISEAISATCYRTGCTIRLVYAAGQLKAHVETRTPRPAEPVLPHEVDLQAEVAGNPFGGIHIQHTGTCGESTTMLHRLKVLWF